MIKRLFTKTIIATVLCLSMAFGIVAIPTVDNATTITAEAASWSSKTMSCTVTGKAKKIVVKWDKLSGAKKYKVQRKEKGGSWKTLTTVGSSKTKYADTSAKSGKTYFYKVTAYNGKKWTKGTKSAAVSLTGGSGSSSSSSKGDGKRVWSPFTNSYVKDGYGQYYEYVDFGSNGKEDVEAFVAGITKSMSKYDQAYQAAKNLVARRGYAAGKCGAYASTYVFICNYLGIDCVYEGGTGSAGYAHAWNRITINGVSYWYDNYMYAKYGKTNYLASTSRFAGYTCTHEELN